MPGRVARAALRESGAPEAACAVWPDGMRLAMPQPCHHVTLSCQSCHAASASPAARLDAGCKSLEGAGVVCVPRLHERAHAHRRTLVCLCVPAHTSGPAAHCVRAYSDGRVQGAYTRRQGARGVLACSAPCDASPRGRLGGRGLRDARRARLEGRARRVIRVRSALPPCGLSRRLSRRDMSVSGRDMSVVSCVVCP
jgi:hypothetical protein